MHKFIQWPKIKNLYNLTTDELNVLCNLNTLWTVTEKIDGTNFSLSITENDYKVGRRNGYLDNNTSFYNIFNNIYKLEKFINNTQKRIEVLNTLQNAKINRIVYFGEYFGNKVINRIYYGNEYQFRIFGCYIEYIDKSSYWVPVKDILIMLDCDSDQETSFVPQLAVYNSFQEACKYPNNQPTTIYRNDKHSDPMEGVVIMPYNISPINGDYNYIIKNKNPIFLEKAIPSSKLQVTDNELESLRNKFKEYCTESRMVSVFSKIGMPLNGINDAGIYIKEWLQDAYEDFIQENSLTNISKGNKRFITSVGSLGFDIFCSIMNKLNK